MDYLLNGIFAGFNNGGVFFLMCSPFLAALVISEKRQRNPEFAVFLEFTLGRLVAYFFAVAIARFVEESTFVFITGLFLCLSSSLLMLYGAVKTLPIFPFFSMLEEKRVLKYVPFLAGAGLGLYLNSPDINAMLQLFPEGSSYAPVSYLFGYFLSTSLILLPLLFISHLSKIESAPVFIKLFNALAVIAGVYFLIRGVLLIV